VIPKHARISSLERFGRWIGQLYPAGFVAGYVLLSFSATPTPLQGLWRPLIVAVAATIALQIVVLAVIRRPHWAAIITSILVMIMAAAWLVLAVLGVIAGWWVAVNALRRRRAQAPMRLAGGRASDTLRVFAVAFAIVAAVPVMGAAPGLAPQPLEPVSGVTAPPDAPDIVVLLLDGYPRADALEEQLSYDNTDFLRSLEDRAFDVAEDSRSNYTATWATIASTMHMRYVHEIDAVTPFPSDAAEQYRQLLRAINQGPAIAELRGRGYEIVAIPSPFESSALVTADRYRDDGHLTSFELSLVQHSVIGKAVLDVVPQWFFDEHRRRIGDGFDAVAEEIERPGPRPRLVFAHLMTPHAPTVFAADGSASTPMDCFPTCSPWAFTELRQWAEVPAQVTYVNARVLATLDRTIAAAPDAVVVVMSDHGSRVTGHSEANLFRTIFAARTPGHAGSIADASPVNLFPQVFNAYFGTEVERRPYRAWISESEAPLTMHATTLTDEQ